MYYILYISPHCQDCLISTFVFSFVSLCEVKISNISHLLGEDSSKCRKPSFNHHQSSLSHVGVVLRCFKLISKSPPSPGKTSKTATLMLVCMLKHGSESENWNVIYYWGWILWKHFQDQNTRWKRRVSLGLREKEIWWYLVQLTGINVNISQANMGPEHSSSKRIVLENILVPLMQIQWKILKCWAHYLFIHIKRLLLSKFILFSSFLILTQ